MILCINTINVGEATNFRQVNNGKRHIPLGRDTGGRLRTGLRQRLLVRNIS